MLYANVPKCCFTPACLAAWWLCVRLCVLARGIDSLLKWLSEWL